MRFERSIKWHRAVLYTFGKFSAELLEDITWRRAVMSYQFGQGLWIRKVESYLGALLYR